MMTKEQAMQLADSGVWKHWTTKEIVDFQLYENLLAMDLSHFHMAIEKELNRPVWTHEFADIESLRLEYENVTNK